MIKEFENYLKKRGVKSNWQMPLLKRVYTYILVVPAYDELDTIPSLLQSLSIQTKNLLIETLIVIVINNGENANEKIRSNNHLLNELINQGDFLFDIRVVDAYSEGKGLPDKYAGVGLARKIGMDLSLPYAQKYSVFGCLDADVILAPNYLEKLASLKAANINAAVLSFEHQEVKKYYQASFKNEIDLDKSKNAIIEYESFLKNTAIELEKIKSPYGYVPLGSAMFCSVQAYVAVGGMPKKKAAEDFYFLQALAKYCGVKSEVSENPIVFPSSRESKRAYLGTGYRMIQAHEGFDIKSLNYKANAFVNLGKFLELAISSRGLGSSEFLNEINLKVPLMLECLKKEGLWSVWSGFSNLKNDKQFVGQFHKWFDGLKTFRCLKMLSQTGEL